MAILNLTEENFEHIINQPALVVITFCSSSSEACALFFNILTDVAQSRPEVIFARCNVDIQHDIAEMLDISAVPAIAVFREGCFIFKQEGAPERAGLVQLVNQALQLDMDLVRSELETA